jgi:parallel beta-helix repeat protein
MLVSMFVSSIMVEPVKGDGEFLITIMPDGTIFPDTAPMTRNGNLYLLTENITLGMYDTFCVIQKGNIVIDGNGHEVKNGYGVSVFDFDGNYYCRNVSIRNMIVKNCSSIIDSNGSNGPNYQDYIRGMTLTNNHFTNGSITLWWTDSINISNNTFVASGQSTALSEWYVSNSVISRNTFADGRYVSLINSPNCAIFENEGSMDIELNASPNSTISNNTMVGSDGDPYDAKGITIWNSENVTISGNNVTGFAYGVGVGGSPKCLISENRLSNMKYDGVCIYVGTDCSGTRISGNFLKDSKTGLFFSSNCTVTDNVISNNNWGVTIGASAGWPYPFPYSKIYHNHFINNTIQAHWGLGGLSSYPWNVTTWDDGYPSGGNYWSDYNGTDFNYDGIGDFPCSLKDTTPSRYFYNLYMGRDRFPLMTSPFAPGLTILEAFYNYTISPDYEVTFDGSLSSASNSTIVKYEWDFGDGTTGVGVTVTHKYNSGIGPLYAMSAAVADPTYSATLKVTDDKGSTNQVTRTVAKANFIAREILPVQAYKVVPSDEFGLVQEKATDFWINCESTFSTPMKTSVRIDLVGFFPDVYEFNYTFTPGSNEFYVGQIIRSSTFFKPWLKPAASFSFTIDPYNLTPETDETDNSPPTGYTQINVTKTDSLRILFVPVRWKNEDGYPSVFNGYSAASLQEQATESIAYIRATYPVAETGGATGGGINYDISCTNSPVTAKTYITGEELERPTTMDEAKDAFVSIAGQLAARAGYRFDRVVGVVRTDWFVGIPGFSAMEGYSITNNPVASVVTLGNWAITPHEMGHSYGLTDLNYRDDGYYVTGRTEVNDAQTWMSTGAIFDPPVEPKLRRPVPYFWVSDNQFLQLFSAMKDPFDPEILSFNADFWQNGTAKLGNLHRYPAGFPTFNEGNIGNYSLVQLDGSNNVLSTVGFNVTFKGAIEEYPEVTLDRVSIAFTIPYLSGAKTIQMRDQLGNVVASKTVSANSPSIHVTSPNGGEVLKSETTQISWEASDLDGDSLTYNLLVSGDGGATWDPVATDLKQTTHNLIVTGFSGGNKYLVKVVASDGVNTAEDVSDGFFTIASFTASLVSVPQTTQAGNKACYLLNLTSYGGFSDPITLSASSSTTNQLNFTWDGGATVTPFVNGSAYVLLDVETLNQIESGNHTIYLSGTCGNNTEVAVTYLFVETHDLAVTNITSSETTVIVGAPAFITVAIQNQGSFGETFDVYLYCNETYLSSQSAYVPAWASINLTFTWDTTGFTEGNYTLTAEVDQVTGEIDTTNNILVLTEQPVTIIPEFPSMLILPAFMLATLVALAICKRKRPDFFRE